MGDLEALNRADGHVADVVANYSVISYGFEIDERLIAVTKGQVVNLNDRGGWRRRHPFLYSEVVPEAVDAGAEWRTMMRADRKPSALKAESCQQDDGRERNQHERCDYASHR
jgi:hypothetical protein